MGELIALKGIDLDRVRAKADSADSAEEIESADGTKDYRALQPTPTSTIRCLYCHAQVSMPSNDGSDDYWEDRIERLRLFNKAHEACGVRWDLR